MIPSNPRYGKFVRERLAEFGRSHAVPESDMREFLTAIGEALANAFEHAQCFGKIEVACWIAAPDQLVATIVDSGVGFDPPDSLGSAPILPALTAERGRGFSIMRRCADHVAVRSIPGKGTAVVLTRFIRRGHSEPGFERARTG